MRSVVSVLSVMVLALLAACGGTGSGPGPLRERREATVNCVWFSGQPGTPTATGGASEVTIRVDPNPSGNPAVGIMEEFAGGTGNQWRTAAWIAAFNASQALGLPIGDQEFLVKAGGHIDGPSAGMLVTATMMALLSGAPILEGTTMTGTINPDGSAGPVGGIPQKMAGAAAKGLKRFGYPIGARSSQDLRTLETVDLEEVASSKGLEAREIKDLWDAYEFMTGRKLERPKPLSESAMEPDVNLATQLRAKTMIWKAKVDSEGPRLKRGLEEMKARGVPLDQLGIAPVLEQAVKAADQAKNFEQSGLIAAAFLSYAEAAVSFDFLNRELDFLKPLMAYDIDGMLARVADARAAKTRVEALGLELKVQSRKDTIGGRVNAIWGLTAYARARAFVEMADDEIANAGRILDQIKAGKLELSDRKVAEALVTSLNLPLIYYAAGDVFVDLAQQLVGIGIEEGARTKGEFADIRKLAHGYASASGAGMAYFDAVFTDELAKQAGVTTQQARTALARNELEYPILRDSAAISESAMSLFRDSPDQGAAFQLAFGVYSYLGAAGLVNKYYSLQGSLEEDGTVKLGNRRALTYQLDLARQRSLEAAGRCKEKLGFVPAASLFNHQLGTALREGSDEDKLEALQSYWTSTLLSELALQLVRS